MMWESRKYYLDITSTNKVKVRITKELQKVYEKLHLERKEMKNCNRVTEILIFFFEILKRYAATANSTNLIALFQRK